MEGGRVFICIQSNQGRLVADWCLLLVMKVMDAVIVFVLGVLWITTRWSWANTRRASRTYNPGDVNVTCTWLIVRRQILPSVLLCFRGRSPRCLALLCDRCGCFHRHMIFHGSDLLQHIRWPMSWQRQLFLENNDICHEQCCLLLLKLSTSKS